MGEHKVTSNFEIFVLKTIWFLLILNFNVFSETFNTLAHEIKWTFVKEEFIIVVEFVKSNSVKMSERMRNIYLCFMYLNLVNYSFVSINVIECIS